MICGCAGSSSPEFESPSAAVIWICTAVAQEIEQIGVDAGPMAGMVARFKVECEKFEWAYNLALAAGYSPKWLWDAVVVCGLQPVVAATVIEEARCPLEPPAPPRGKGHFLSSHHSCHSSGRSRSHAQPESAEIWQLHRQLQPEPLQSSDLVQLVLRLFWGSPNA